MASGKSPITEETEYGVLMDEISPVDLIDRLDKAIVKYLQSEAARMRIFDPVIRQFKTDRKGNRVNYDRR